MFILQHIWSHWTKASRAAGEARPRRAEALPLSLPTDPAPTAWLHAVRMHEREGFEVIEAAAPLTATDWSAAWPAHPANLSWRHVGQAVAVTLLEPWPGMLRTAWPAHLPSPITVLQPGDVVRIDWNGRFLASMGGSDRSYFYAEHTFWLAVSDAPSRELFVKATPRKHIDLRTRIY